MLFVIQCNTIVYFRWFRFDTHPVTMKDDWLYTGKYWDRDWAKCPDIF